MLRHLLYLKAIRSDIYLLATINSVNSITAADSVIQFLLEDFTKQNFPQNFANYIWDRVMYSFKQKQNTPWYIPTMALGQFRSKSINVRLSWNITHKGSRHNLQKHILTVSLHTNKWAQMCLSHQNNNSTKNGIFFFRICTFEPNTTLRVP